ncbi:MAG: TetR/AcrR family transcriptional regulator [Myxococcota bacterium]
MAKSAPAGELGPAKRKVLEAAEEEFSRHGFAGARIDAIAARAGLAKSHVYYHFEGKQEIFQQLVALRVGEMLAQKDELLASVTALTPEVVADFVPRVVTELLAPRARFLRVVLLESLGSGDGGQPLLLEVLRPLFADITGRFEALGYELERDQFLSDVFHFGVLPAVGHVALGDRFAKAAGLSPRRARELFVRRLVDLQALNLKQLARRPRRGGSA